MQMPLSYVKYLVLLINVSKWEIIENWTNLVTTRVTILVATENWTILFVKRITILVATENWTILVATRIVVILW